MAFLDAVHEQHVSSGLYAFIDDISSVGELNI